MQLVPIDSNNWEEVVSLTTNASGIPTLEEKFLASNAYSMLQAQYEEGWRVRGIEENGKLVGFTMFGYNRAECFYEISRLMIDRRFQSRGFGRKALRLVKEEMKKIKGIREIYISAEPENQKALSLYLSEGFLDTGKVVEGERLLVMKTDAAELSDT